MQCSFVLYPPFYCSKSLNVVFVLNTVVIVLVNVVFLLVQYLLKEDPYTFLVTEKCNLSRRADRRR